MLLSTLLLTPQRALPAPNVWLLPFPSAALERARRIFDEALMPVLVEQDLIDAIDVLPIPCAEISDKEHGEFFVMRGGSSTNELKRKSSDLAWISVNDEATFENFRDIFEMSGIAEQLAPVCDTHGGSMRLFSSFYVVRSRCADANFHTDWADAVGKNAFTLLTPLYDYPTADFHLLYKDTVGSTHQYRYRAGEAICFSSHFVHSTEPGAARANDALGRRLPHAFLCFTFGSDKEEHWRHIAPTINGYQSRFLHNWRGVSELTEIGTHLACAPEQAGAMRVGS